MSGRPLHHKRTAKHSRAVDLAAGPGLEVTLSLLGISQVRQACLPFEMAYSFFFHSLWAHMSARVMSRQSFPLACFHVGNSRESEQHGESCSRSRHPRVHSYLCEMHRKGITRTQLMILCCLCAGKKQQQRAGECGATPLQAIDTRASGKRLTEALFGDRAEEPNGKRPRHAAHDLGEADGDVIRAQPGNGQAADQPESRKKRKSMKKVASHTGKYCDNDTMRSLVAAFAEAAEEEGDKADTDAEASHMSGKAKKSNNKIQGKGGRRSVSRLTIEKRKLKYDSGSDQDNRTGTKETLVAAPRNGLHAAPAKAQEFQHRGNKHKRKHERVTQ